MKSSLSWGLLALTSCGGCDGLQKGVVLAQDRDVRVRSGEYARITPVASGRNEPRSAHRRPTLQDEPEPKGHGQRPKTAMATAITPETST